MAPPLNQPETVAKRQVRIKKRQLSAIKEEDELKNTSQDLSTLYVNEEKPKPVKTVSKIPKVKKKSVSKLNNNKQSTSVTKTESSKKEKKLVNTSQTKNKVSKKKVKEEIPSTLLERKSPIPLKYQPPTTLTYVPVVRSFVESDVTSLPLDDLIGKRPYLAKNDSKLPKPSVNKASQKKTKKSTTTNSSANKPASEKRPVTKTSTKDSNFSTAKKHKVKKNTSKIPKSVTKPKKTSSAKKIVAKVLV